MDKPIYLSYMRVKSWLAAIILTTLIISLSVTIVLYFKPLYYLDMQKYDLAEKYGVDAISDLKDAHTFNIIDVSGMFPGEENSLAARPHNYYVFTFYVAPMIVALSVRSTGEIKILEIFDDMPYGLHDSEYK